MPGEPPHCPPGGGVCRYLGELESLRHEVSRLAEQVNRDALTGLHNFRFFQQTLPMEMERTQRSGQPLALILLDIDHFKQFNDRWGHEVGNKALVQVAGLINTAIRKLDIACRFGGEEFVLLLPNTDLPQAVRVAQRLRDTIANSPLHHEEKAIGLTASLGVEEFRARDRDSPESLIKRVDIWLYQAKHSGRNLVAHPPFTHNSQSVTAEERDALFDDWDQD